jgi:transposase-like protein
MSTVATQQNPVCPECGCKYTVKKGKRRNRLQIHQVFKCTECLHRFTGAPAKNKTYPLRLILETVSTFNLGYSLTETQRLLHTRFHRNIPERTISSWLTEYRPLTTYSRLRTDGKKLFAPETIIRTINFDHQQIYRHQIHGAKLKILFESPLHSAFAPLTKYLEGLETHFPNHLFEAAQHRSSKFPAELRPPIARKENHANLNNGHSEQIMLDSCRAKNQEHPHNLSTRHSEWIFWERRWR